MQLLAVKIKQLALEYASEILHNRRHLHQHPELSFVEFETAKFVEQQLKSFGIEVQTQVAGTGVIGILKGKNPEKNTFALRGDMDALPIKEANDVSYKSVNEGVMHACGHDVHTASLLGTARILSKITSDFEGTIKFIFQPGEEKSPGGASLMIKEGVLQNPTPNGILGQHVAPQITAGKIGFREGIYMASADEVYIKVIGKGGHAAMPENNIDPIVIASHIIIALQQIVSRFASPKMPTVLSFGKIVANGATNVIPNEVLIEGTFRTMNEKWREDAKARMKKMAESMAEGMGAKCELTFAPGYPYLENNPALTKRVRAYATEYVGSENIIDLDLWMASEDFAFYTHHTDACFYRLGVRNEEKGITSPVHTPTFDIDESALELGAGLMAWLAVNELNK
ncbi:MAG: amidohydrolase [Bacteroidetes bacterium]|nr:MAG: amidohydrolase [Bacteroidota bacterium]